MIGFLELLWRSIEIVCWTGLHGLLWVCRWLWCRLLRRRLTSAQVASRAVSALLESLGPTFIKAGQVLSARPDLLPGPLVAQLRRLQDRVAPPNLRRALAQAEAAFGRPLDEVFQSFETQPLCSASVAVVHRARLADGSEVAVKIRRPGIVRKVRNDLRLVRLSAALLVRLPRFRFLPFDLVMQEVSQAIEQQLDFEAEAENNRRFRQNFAHVDQVTIPALIDDLCSESVLVMEYLADLQKVDEPNDLRRKDGEKGAMIGLRALYKMIFIDGFVHADMHPGNVFVREWGEFVMLDFGLVATLDDPTLRHFVDFFFGMVSNDGLECSRVVRSTAIHLAPWFEQAQFEQQMIQLVERHSSLDASEFEVTRFAVELFETQRRCGLLGSAAFSMTILSLVVFEGIVKLLYPSLDFQAEARAFLIAARARPSPPSPSLVPGIS